MSDDDSDSVEDEEMAFDGDEDEFDDHVTGFEDGEMEFDDEEAGDADEDPDFGDDESELGDVDGEFDESSSEFDDSLGDFDEMDDDIDGMNADFDEMDGEFGDADDSFDDTDTDFDDTNADFDDTNADFDDTNADFDDGMEFDNDDTMEFDNDDHGEIETEASDVGESNADFDGDDGGAVSPDSESAPSGANQGSESSGPDRETVVGLQGEQLADILSQAWVNRGWETDIVEDEDGSFFVTGDQGNGQRGLILVLPGSVEVPGKRLQQYASLVEKKSVDVRVVATQGEFTDDAERIAKANNVHLLDPQAVLETVEAEGLEDALSTFGAENGSGGGDGGSGGGIGAMVSTLPIPAVGLPGGVPLPSLRGKGLKSVLLIVLIATSLLAGFAGGAVLGPGDGGGGVTAAVGGLGSLGGGGSDFAVASLSTAEPGKAGLTVRWNARTADSVVANGSSYEAPGDARFLVVQLVVRNTGDDRVPVKAGDFLVNANGTRYAHQPLDGTRTFEMAALSPGNETTGWVVFAIPNDVNDAVLVPNTDAAGGPVTFVRDSSLAINGTA